MDIKKHTSKGLFVDFLIVFLAPDLEEIFGTVVILLDLGGDCHKDWAVFHVLMV